MRTSDGQWSRRGLIRAGGVGVLALAWPVSGHAAEETSSGGFCYFVMADPQLFWGSKEDWARAIGYANKLKPDFVIVCGDLVNHAGNEDEAKAYLEVAATLDKSIPLYNVVGNHDYNPADMKSLALYQSRFGAPWYSFEHKNCLFIVFESTMIKAGVEGPVYEWQMQVAGADAAGGPGQGLRSHHGLHTLPAGAAPGR